ncbi:MAG TPA: hypothetical protein VF656_07115 [Pyrinomonadaceae bacterium]
MSRAFTPFLCLALLAIACNFGGRDETGQAGNSNTSGRSATASMEGGAPTRAASGAVEGKDYVVLERVRLLDQQGFDQPVEAMSVLVPRGWRTEGGVRWRSPNECRGEIVTWQMTATSPDGAIRFTVLPLRTFVTSQDQMTQQSLLAAAQQGGCAVSQPFDAARWLANLARTELGGASVSNVREDESLRPVLDKISSGGNAASQQYGTGMNQTSSAVYGTLTWPDGDRGLAQVGVSVMETQGSDPYTGAPSGFASTTVFHQVFIRYPPAREAEALKLFGTIITSYRANPVWQQGKERLLTQLGNAEHAGRMERLRLQGEQAAAYARTQSEASDARMRDWERSQASSDAGHQRFIQTVREVETWKDASGSPVELSAGYQHGWSRPDGSIILTNNSLFDPAVELQQNWSRMEKQQR